MRFHIRRRLLATAVLAVVMLFPFNLTGIASAAALECDSVNLADTSNCPLITKYVNPLINLLIALIGIAVVASIIIGGIQYSSAGGDPGKVSAAKKRIREALLALLAFALLFTLLNFLIPGGLSLGV